MKNDKIDSTVNQLFNTACTRRDSLRLLGSTAALAGITSLGFPSSLLAGKGRKKPNIVFILTDDHRWDCLGVMGHPFLQTPNMDRLANEGMLFENAFVTTSLCSPSRASFLTGQYASVHGVKNNFSHWDENKNKTFMEHLKNGGYDTGFVGKWHMPGGSLPNLPGVDLFVSFTKKDGQGDYFNCPIYVNHELTPNRKPYITEELTDYAIDFVKQERENPFCLYLSHKAVHHDWKPPEHLKGIYKNADLSHLAPESDKYNTWTNLNWLEGTMGNMHNVYRRYCECLTSVDEQVGRLIDTLEQKGILDDTIIVYAGDNGYIWGEHRLYAKHHPYEESIRIPYIVRPPKGYMTDTGRRADQMILNIDLAPTLLNMAGIPIPGAMQGESFLPILNSANASGRKSWVYELFRDFPFGGRVPPHKALRTNRYKYIDWELCNTPEVYDLQEDPRELNNLFGTERGTKLAKGLLAELEEMKVKYNLVNT
ncbi:MAG: sulfatase [Deltaproteobacteria bacterium]|nr:sulfatase [Deltaproteobacteria bacterium]